MGGTLVETGAEKMAGIDISYNGVWGYHSLVVSLANTGEVLSVVNRSGNYTDQVRSVCFTEALSQDLLVLADDATDARRVSV